MPNATQRVAAIAQGAVRALALGLALASVLAPWPIPAEAAPTGRTSRQADAASPFRSVGGGLALVALPKARAASIARHHELHPDASPGQHHEALEWTQGGDVLVRLEIFANHRREPLQAWLDGEQRALAVQANEVAHVAPPSASPQPAAAVLLGFNRSSQAPARQILLLSPPHLRLRLTCEDSQHARAGATFAAVRAALRLRALAETRP